MSAPLTTQRIGSRVCVGCERDFTTGGVPLLIEGDEPVRNRYGGFSDGRTRRTSRRWHVSCLAEFEERNAAYRAQVEADRLAMVRELGRAAGWSDKRIEAFIANPTPSPTSGRDGNAT